MKLKMNLQRFAEGGEGGSNGNGDNGNGSQGGNAGYSYEQLEEIASARVAKAERAAIAGYLRNKGMSEEDITTAITDFKAKQSANKPDVSALTTERDAALEKVAQYEHEKELVKKGVNAEYIDYVTFKVSKMVTDKKDFKTAADEFLKENPKYIGGGSGQYRMSSGSASGNSNTASTPNDEINNMIRNAFRR